MDYKILNWNIRGLNNPAKRRATLIFVAQIGCNIVCLQEVKLAAITPAIVTEILGARFRENFIFKPAVGTRGGILIACSTDFEITHEPLADGPNSIIGTVRDRTNNDAWTLSAVYRPQEVSDKISFIEEIKNIKQFALDCWMVTGDFNLIKKADEKSNGNINLQMMGRFRSALDQLELLEFPLLGRKFTWSNERENVTLTKIDRVLVTEAWELKFPNYQLTPASTSISDHCPLVLKPMDLQHFKGFRFESFWLAKPDFLEVVTKAWEKPVQSADPCRKLHTKLSRTAKALTKWNRKASKRSRLMYNIATELILPKKEEH